jgi:hypothetical protein
MAQLKDSFDYADQMMGRRPKPARLNMGFGADLFGLINKNVPFAGCFDYRSQGVGNVIFPPIAPVIQVLATLLRVGTTEVLADDIYLPTGGIQEHSRGVFTHEYGHYVMCDVYEDSRNPFDPFGDTGIAPLYRAWLYEGGYVHEGDESTSIAMETFADFFAAQVVSGTNYAWPNKSSPSLGMSYCTAPDCMEFNEPPETSPPGSDLFREKLEHLLRGRERSSRPVSSPHLRGWTT